MKYLILVILLTACSPDMSRHETTVTPPPPAEETPVPVEPTPPPVDEQPPAEEPAPAPKKKCMVVFHWRLMYPGGYSQVFEYQNLNEYRQVQLPAHVQSYKLEYEQKQDTCARAHLYNYYGQWLGSTNIWCEPCVMEE